MAVKSCTRCKIPKDFSEFHLARGNKDGHALTCKMCMSVICKERNRRKKLGIPGVLESRVKPYGPVGHPQYRFYSKIKSRFGMTMEDYQNLFNTQDFKCAICKKPETLVGKLQLDHCHVTNKVRGLLCIQCNTGLGKFYDNSESLQNAINYLKN